MNIHRYILIAALGVATATTAADAGRKAVSDIAPYVYPANRPASPAAMTFMPDGESYVQSSADHKMLLRYDTRSAALIDTVFNASHTRETSIDEFESFILSDDGKKVIFVTDSRPIYRRSTDAVHYVYELRTNILRPLSVNHARQQSPVFSPDSRVVAFVADNNIYLKKLDFDTEVAVTTDGAPGCIINGVPDWTYEEEFTTTCSMAWSPDSGTLSYVKYDETDVPMYHLALYQGACDPSDEYALYPGTLSYKYPVAGMPNSRVSIHCYDLSTRKTKDITLPGEAPQYIPRLLATADSTVVLAVTLNRDQNRMEIFSVNPASTTSKSLLTETSKAWIAPESYEDITLTPKSIIIHSSRSGYNHLYEYGFNGALLRQLTSGNYDVTACYGIDAKGSVWYQSAKSSPLDRVISKVDTKGRTTDITPPGMTSSATFSPTLNYYTLKQSDALTPPVYTLCSDDGKVSRTLVDNANYAATHSSLPRKEFTTITSDGVELNAYIIKPADFNPSKRYPVIMWQYSGPGSQQVLNSWALDWDYYAATKGFIVVCVDPRGTGCRGREFETVVYRDLGHYETIDQINAARYVASLPYVDASAIGIAGWSYGGYETLMCATQPATPFAAAVAIAPVTDWRYYDTVYAERYMLTPQANEDGYNASAPISRVSNLGIPTLLMYGTHDDNVHPANTLEFVAHLQADGAMCDMLVFPTMNHSINGCNTRAIVYAKMVDYFSRNM